MSHMPDELRSFIEMYEEDHPNDQRAYTENVICQRCKGEGTHGNPAFDGTSVEWWLEGDESGEDLEEYMHGTRYDVLCEECRGEKVVRELTHENPPELLLAWDEWQQSVYEMHAEMEAERRMGA